jgi:hypothetical protein
MIARDTVEPSRLQGRASEEITSPYNQSNLNANTHQLAYLQGHLIQDLGIYTKRFIAGKGLTTQLE